MERQPDVIPSPDPERPEHTPQREGGRDFKRHEEEEERREQNDRTPPPER